MNNQNLKLFVLALIAFFIIAVMASCQGTKPLTSLEYHKNLQSEMTFEKAMSRNESFTLKSYEDDLKALREKIKESNKKDVTEAKKAKLLAEIDALKSKIK